MHRKPGTEPKKQPKKRYNTKYSEYQRYPHHHQQAQNAFFFLLQLNRNKLNAGIQYSCKGVEDTVYIVYQTTGWSTWLDISCSQDIILFCLIIVLLSTLHAPVSPV